MSTASTQPLAPALRRPRSAPDGTGAASPGDAVAPLVAASGLRPEDRVRVIGRNVLNHLLALAHCGCRSAVGIAPHFPAGRSEGVDVIWIIGVRDVDAEVAPILRAIGNVRLVAIELLDTASFDRLRLLLRGFDHRTIRHDAGIGTGCIVVARHPGRMYRAV